MWRIIAKVWIFEVSPCIVAVWPWIFLGLYGYKPKKKILKPQIFLSYKALLPVKREVVAMCTLPLVATSQKTTRFASFGH
jgi:hypothetical protein